ncbi:double-cubane-cluster-containing anaerobic reductase [Natranaerobius thermophilus]|uniref:double-cubane-cluster-containing anaerobic reductase n=1 Tax=Natranaerobius thermophilus TaxID=375929 RepID=UPI0002EF9F75|nr:double-cubane-cluster-containing anaerobic reductase [Natranaerobius thermophilus]
MRPQTMEFFDSLIPENMAKIKELKEAGRNVVGYYCVFTPVELIEASGAIPVGLCATKQDPIPAAEEDLPRNLCPLIKSSYGFAKTDTCPFFYFSDVVMAETTCDGKKKMYEMLNEYKPMMVLDIPNSSTYEKKQEHWIQELKRAKSYLEEQFDVEVTQESLEKAIKGHNQERTKLMELVSLNQHNPAPLSGQDLLKVIWARQFQLNRDEYLEKIQNIINETKEIINNQSFDDSLAKKPRILVTGSPTGVGQEKTLNIIEQQGGQVVLKEACSGVKGLVKNISETEEPLAAIAEKYMELPCSCISPNDGRFELISELVKDYQIDGVIDITLQACHTYNIESYLLKEHLQKNHDIPMLQIETDYTDTDVEQIKLRVDSFLEMLS